MKRPLSLLFVFMFLFTACSVNKPTVATVSGSYHCTIERGFVWASIELKKDSTFTWNFGDDTGDKQISIGKWVLKGNAIVLNSFPHTVNPYLFIPRMVDTDTMHGSSIKVWSGDSNEMPFVQCYVYSKGMMNEYMTDIDGFVRVKEQCIDSIRVQGYDARVIKFIPPDKLRHSFVFHLEYEVAVYKDYVNEKWRYKDGKIYLPKKYEYQYNYYERRTDTPPKAGN